MTSVQGAPASRSDMLLLHFISMGGCLFWQAMNMECSSLMVGRMGKREPECLSLASLVDQRESVLP